MGNNDKKSLIKKYIFLVITIALCGEMFFYPLQGAFRFSIGVIALNLILLLHEDINEVYLAFFSGIFILILRSFIHSLNGFDNIWDLFSMDFPASVYYILSGILFHSLRVRYSKNNTFRTIYLLATIDIFCNIIESLLRKDLNQDIIRYIVFIAMMRSVLVYLLYYISNSKEQLIKRKENEKKYNQLNTIITSIQAEIFYLNKSTSDIENIMKKAYTLYEKTKNDKELNQIALDLAREVHEIKKDYNRVVNGFKSYVDNFEFGKSMSLETIGSIIEGNLNRYIQYLNKDIEVYIDFDNNALIKDYYFLFTIVNNLIINSIDAIVDKGKICVQGLFINNEFLLKVDDNGPGINDELIPYIFNPGFTTKYDLKSGEPSTGIGLSHVKYIVENLEGNIEVISASNRGTSFIITIPNHNLRE